MTAPKTDERLRLFVAIPVPESVRAEISRVQDELKPLVPSSVVRWTMPEQFHLTLKFLGDVSAERVEALRQAVQGVCAGEAALPLRVRGVGFFPNARAPRVIWVGVDDDKGRLAALQGKVEDAVREFSEERGAERFCGHATLGRFKKYRRREIEKLLHRVEAMVAHDFGQWTAHAVEIVRSELSPSGASHMPLAAVTLGAE